MVSFCRDCLADVPDGGARCTACGSPRVARHPELARLAIAHVATATPSTRLRGQWGLKLTGDNLAPPFHADSQPWSSSRALAFAAGVLAVARHARR
jgi:hypothetical protein